MTQKIVKIILPFLNLFLVSSLLPGQSVIQLHTDQPFSHRQKLSPPASPRNGGPDTLAFSAAAPFFDDFSYPGTMPDSNLWYTPEVILQTPIISKGLAIAPPTRGALTFDGANRLGLPYDETSLSSGTADRLISHYLDLSNLGPAAQIKLSFSLQAKGNGESPEANDSFFVYFRTPLPPPMDFQKVFAAGGGNASGFKSYVISVDQPEFFHAQFQIIFESMGSLNGYLDHWHLDYVYMGTNRADGDTSFQDRSPIALLNSPLSPYTAIPVQHFNNLGNIMQPFEVAIGNRENGTASVPLSVEISDPVGGSNLNTPFQQQTTVSFSGYGAQINGFNAFAQQNINKIAALELSASIPDNHDPYPANNTFTETFGIDSLFAYDDGEADRSFGINRALGFGVEYNMPQPDSLVAVWISFVPTVNFNPVSNKTTYMDDHPFRLVVYNRPHPDSLLLQQLGGIRVKYGDQPNHFERYVLSKPLPVPQTFWVGIQQTNPLPIGVGFDENYDSSNKTYWDSLGFWVNTNLKGSLMIRPEMYNTASLPASNNPPLDFQSRVNIFPNPISDRRVNIALEFEEPGFSYRARMVDIMGREILNISQNRVNHTELTFELPAGLQPGVYLWIHEIQTRQGSKYSLSEKIFIN
jgi:hypothetical protein